MALKHRKIYQHVWDDEKFFRLDVSEKLLALYVLTGQSNRIGIFCFSAGQAAEHTGIPVGPPGHVPPHVSGTSPAGGLGVPKTFADRLDAVCQALGWKYDPAARVLYIPTWWKYNPPENPSVLVGALGDAEEIPQTPLLAEFWANTRYLKESLAGVLRARAPHIPPHVSGTSPPTSGGRPPHQEQEQEQDLTPLPPHGGSGRPSSVEPAKSPARSKANPEADPLFDRFWAAFPRRENKAKAAKAFAKLGPDADLFARMLAAIERQRISGCLEPRTTDDGRSTIPHPTTWLNGRRWEDEPAAVLPAPTDDAAKRTRDRIERDLAAPPAPPLDCTPTRGATA